MGRVTKTSGLPAAMLSDCRSALSSIGVRISASTSGAAGLAEDLAGSGKLVAIDRDPTAKSYFDRFKAGAGVDVRFLRGDFSLVLAQLAANDVRADAILLDVGVSSMQIDRPERGFSYATDAPLDMRMDPTSAPTAAEILNTWDERELADVFRRYGEERYARQIARAIVRQRAGRSFERTGELVETIKSAIPTPARFGEGHPAKRVFQHSHRGQRRARSTRSRAAAGSRDASPGWAPRRDHLPLARGPGT